MRLEFRPSEATWWHANNRTTGRLIDRIIFAKAGLGQQESGAAPTNGLTIEEFLWHMVRQASPA
jgi:hypothetical protein